MRKDDRGQQTAKWQLENIMEMIEKSNAEDEDEREQAIEQIQEHPFSIEVRSDWHVPGQENLANVEYRILVSGGGPACQVTGELNEYGEPESAKIQYQDWFTSWEDVNISDEEEEALLCYASHFYYGEG